MFFMKNIFASLMLLLFSAPVWAELEVIALKHRSAEELLPVIRPLLDKGDVASGMNYQLILRTSTYNLAQIKKLLESLDIALRNLQITVMQNVDSETVARLTEISGSAGLSREARITVSGGGNNSGLNVDAGQGRDRLKAHVISTRSLEDDRKTQKLQVLEGSRALVHSGQSVAVPQRQVIQNQWGTRVIDSTRYQEVGSGFYVLPRVNGDRVTLEISAQNDSLAPGGGDQPTMRVQQTSSVISGRLGEWLEVGGLGQQKSSNDAAISTRSASQSREQRSVLIKVEEVK
jgi:type II secretory pathway component GspD/PulD (secretin)